MKTEAVIADDKKDFELIKLSALELLNNGSEGDERVWRNPDSDNSGNIVLTGIYSEGEFAEYECRTLSMKLYNKDKLIKQTTRSLCKNDNNQWDFDE